jgi:hypothetical protein
LLGERGWSCGEEEREKMVGPTFGGGEWRASKNGGWEGKFGGVWKIEVCLEALLELDFTQNLQIFE